MPGQSGMPRKRRQGWLRRRQCRFREKDHEEEPSEIIKELVSERGLPKTDGVIWADIGDEEPEEVEVTVSSFWNVDGSGLVLHAECSVENQKEGASVVVKRERLSVYTPSDADRKEKTEDEP